MIYTYIIYLYNYFLAWWSLRMTLSVCWPPPLSMENHSSKVSLESKTSGMM